MTEEQQKQIASKLDELTKRLEERLREVQETLDNSSYSLSIIENRTKDIATFKKRYENLSLEHGVAKVIINDLNGGFITMLDLIEEVNVAK